MLPAPIIAWIAIYHFSPEVLPYQAAYTGQLASPVGQ
jgi:hypothetical protein